MTLQEHIVEAVGKLEALRFFPDTENGHIAIMELIGRMATNHEQVDWLVRTMIDRVGSYQGTDQLRAVFCMRFKPADGIEANLSPECPIYRTEEQCEQAEKLRAASFEPPRLIGGSTVALLEPATEEVQENRRFARSLVESLVDIVGMPEPPKPEPAPITQDDIDRAKAEYLAKKATRQ